MENLKTMVFYFSVTLLLLLVAGANSFHTYVESFQPYLPSGAIFKISVVVIITLGYLLYQREQRTNKIKYEFLTIATHQFRTPITAIKWLVNSLKGEMLYEERMKVVKQLGVLVERISDVVDALSGLARFDNSLSYAFEVAWPRDMVDVSLSKYGERAHEKGIKFNIQADHDIPLVIIDKRKIQSVIDVLFDNAIVYSPAGGEIDVNLKKFGKFVILSVRDRGIGIKFSDTGRVFKRFWRGTEAKRIAPEGMGLSLSVMKEIINKHGGRIWAESAGLGKGATFFVKLKASNK